MAITFAIKCSSTLSFLLPLSQTMSAAALTPSRVVQDHLSRSYSPRLRVLLLDCTAEDVDFHYTDCIGNFTNLIFNWRPGTVCSGGVTLPSNVAGLPCRTFPLTIVRLLLLSLTSPFLSAITCDAGSYLPIGDVTCRDCPAGASSWPFISFFVISYSFRVLQSRRRSSLGTLGRMAFALCELLHVLPRLPRSTPQWHQ